MSLIDSIRRIFNKKEVQGNSNNQEMLASLSRMFGSEQEDCLSVTKGFQVLIQATDDATDEKELGVKAGFIPEESSTDEAIGILFATYIFRLYEKKFSPTIAYRLLEIFCREPILQSYKVTYCHLYAQLSKEQVNFNNINIDPIMDIYSMACHAKDIGYKIHWNPFKEPFCSLRICGFEGKQPVKSM